MLALEEKLSTVKPRAIADEFPQLPSRISSAMLPSWVCPAANGELGTKETSWSTTASVLGVTGRGYLSGHTDCQLNLIEHVLHPPGVLSTIAPILSEETRVVL